MSCPISVFKNFYVFSCISWANESLIFSLLMVLFIIFCPIVAAILIMIGAPARKTALVTSVLTFAAALYLLATFGDGEHGFQHVTSFTISPEWRLSFTTGIDGLSLIMVLLATIVTLAAV